MTNMEITSCETIPLRRGCLVSTSLELSQGLEEYETRVSSTGIHNSSDMVENENENEKEKSLLVVSSTASPTPSPRSVLSSCGVLGKRGCSSQDGNDLKIEPRTMSLCTKLSNEEKSNDDRPLASCSRRLPERNPDCERIVADTIIWGNPLFEKKLCSSDVGDFNRLSIYRRMALKHLPPLKFDDEYYKPLITFVDYKNRAWVMKYGWWPSGNIVLCRGWNDFVKHYNICCGDTIQIYAHVDHQLHVRGVDDTRYVYGIHFSKPSNSRSISRWWGSYWVVNENKNGDATDTTTPNNGDSRFRPNGGRRRARKTVARPHGV